MRLDSLLGVEGATTRSFQSELPSVNDVAVEGSGIVEKPAMTEGLAAVERPAVVEGPAIAAKA
jgi:hypothetical protein